MLSNEIKDNVLFDIDVILLLVKINKNILNLGKPQKETRMERGKALP